MMPDDGQMGRPGQRPEQAADEPGNRGGMYL
jgi:hypothetical protein